jgi:hypothetical protein
MGCEGSPHGSGGIGLKVIILYDGGPIIKCTCISTLGLTIIYFLI